MERDPFVSLSLSQDDPVMIFSDLFAQRKANTLSFIFIFTVKALKDDEYLFSKLLVKPDSVIHRLCQYDSSRHSGNTAVFLQEPAKPASKICGFILGHLLYLHAVYWFLQLTAVKADH
jgi:hypothetical protein